MQKVFGRNRRIRFTQSTLRQASIQEKKGPSLGKNKSKFLISEVPTLWNLRTDLRKRLQYNSDAPAARHGTLPKTHTSSKKKTKLHWTRPQRNGIAGYKKGAGRKIVCANNRRSDGICQRIGLIRDSHASWRNTRCSFTREALRGSWVNLPLDQRSKTTTHQKKARKLIGICQIVCHSLSLVYRRVPLHHPHLLPQRILYLTSADTRKMP